MLPSVSVALCTYNGAAYVADQLESILSQDPSPKEVVVSDDGSTDDTIAIVRRVHGQLGGAIRLTILTGESTLGVTANFERAITACTEDVIALSDQDDVWLPGRLASALAILERDDSVLLVHSDARLVDASGAPIGNTLSEALAISARERELVNSGRAIEAYVRRNLVTGAATVFRASLAIVATPFPREWVHDEWLGTIAAIIGRVAIDERVVLDYRQHGANQIGAAKPTLRYRIGRILEPRGDRYRALAARSEVLLTRLDALSPTGEARHLLERKARFEAARAAYPENRIRRLPHVLAQARHGRYTELSSQGRLDIVRDILQPPGW